MYDIATPEAAVLGCLLLDDQADIAGLQSKHFLDPRCRIIFYAINRLKEDSRPVDQIMLIELLEQEKLMERAGGHNFLLSLTDQPTAANSRQYAEAVMRTWQKVCYQRALEEAQKALESGSDINLVSARLEKEIESVRESRLMNGQDFMFTPITSIKFEAPDWLIEGFIESGTLVSLFSDANVGKTFLAIDWALSIGHGVPWRGKYPVKKGPVLYILGEGQRGMKRRTQAWHLYNGLSEREDSLLISLRATALSEAGSVLELERAIRKAAVKYGEPILIVFDTYARNLGPADENSTQDTNQIVATADRLREKFNATVLFIHHIGHKNGERGRGSSALRGALDHEYLLQKAENGIITLTCKKMKDSAYPKPISFRLEEFELDSLPSVDPVTSAVLVETDDIPANRSVSKKDQNKQILLEALEIEIQRHRQRLTEGGYDPAGAHVKKERWRKTCEELGLTDRKRFYDAKSALIEEGLITTDDYYVYLVV